MNTSTIRFELVRKYKEWLAENFIMGDSALTFLYWLDQHGLTNNKACEDYVKALKGVSNEDSY